MKGKIDALFQPMKIGTMKVKNRIAMAPMGLHAKNPDGSFNQDAVDLYVARAKGGVGLIVTTGIACQNKLDAMHATLATAGDSYIESNKKLTDEVHKYGAKIVLQIANGAGRNRKDGFFIDNDPISSSENPNVWHPEMMHRALTTEEVQFLIQSYANGAYIAKQAGFDGVEVHALHEGYLMDQFSMECTNRRTDQYGGSLENRLRYATETVQAIKKKCGKDFPVLIRYSVKSYMKGLGIDKGALPGENFVEYGRDLEESAKIAKILQGAGYDALDADNGTYESWYFAHPPVYMPKACNLADAQYIKQFVDIPVICAGKMDDPEISTEAVANGSIDAISVGRALLADPEWPHKVQAENFDDIRPCIGCHAGCLERFFSGKNTSCAINPQVGMESKYEIKPADVKKNIMVIGGGISGMEAARISALRGHKVDLYERTNNLGGVFIPASSMSFKDEDKKLIQWYVKQLKDTGVTVHMNTEVNENTIKTAKPDSVFVATGSTARKLTIDGADSEKVITAVEALLETKPISDKVVVIGGGLTGVEIAYSLTKDKGKHVEILEMLPDILQVKGLNAANKTMLQNLVLSHNIGVHTNVNVTAITSNGVQFEENGSSVELDAGTIITSIGYISDKSLYEALKDCGAEVHLIGDASKVSNLMGAIWDAYEIAMAI
ncbi:oxidoreductase [Anaerocolumna sp. MB42-C2]|uniref:oxidoreductase n=1 Tax=Anaerocolumna sp. MB42-C2 TaxID=3070997 RepID=UPI0027E10E07|nr:FAD-dependent oxidoreductase [Anaerocolumna sp. MB42-C2]WMJ86840.1 FAD-dependent oxidoreductase [Anaerocolumna sp. MB42-C2]